MTTISFYTNVTHPMQLLGQLVQKALKQRRQVTIFAQGESYAEGLSQQLWALDPVAFIPNVMANDHLAPLTPVVIDWRKETIFQDDILIYLHHEQPVFFSRFKHLVEIVGMDEHEKSAARKRYAFYRERGYEIKHVDISKKAI